MISSRPKVVVLGGGFGGLEAALSVRQRLGDDADITMVSDQEYFLFKPNTIYLPFGMDPGRLKFRLIRPTKHKNIKLVHSLAREIDPISRLVYLDAGSGSNDDNKIAYDYLVVATGAGARPDEIPGLSQFGVMAWTLEQMVALRQSLQKLVLDAKTGGVQRVLFLVSPNSSCPGPLYEMAMLLDTWLRHKHVREQVKIAWSTHEMAYLQVFGPHFHDTVTEEFCRRSISGYSSYHVDRVEKGEVVYRNGETLPFDLLVSFPPQGASTYFSGMPADARGFLFTDPQTGQISGYPDIYAIGDAANFPMKQAYLASLQADAAIGHMAAQVLGTAPIGQADKAGHPATKGGGKAALDQLSQGPAGRGATLAGYPGQNGAVAYEDQADTANLYRLGPSPGWWLGKSAAKIALGVYLPWRFKAGNPFHAGVPWKGMDAALKFMAAVPAT